MKKVIVYVRKFKNYGSWLIVLWLCNACVQPYGVEITADKSYLIVDGIITDLPEQQYVSIFRSNPDVTFVSSENTNEIIGSDTLAVPLVRASVEVVVNNTTTIRLTESEAGVYVFPNNFKAKVGDTFKLRITSPDGTAYESSVEKMLPVAPIKKVSEEFNETGIVRKSVYGDKTPTNDISIDFDDPANEKNFYRWRWFDYESLKICESCRRGRYYIYETRSGFVGNCLTDLKLGGKDIFDYTCESICWDIIPSNDILIASDIYTNGQPQVAKLVAQIPLYQLNPCMVSVQQMSMSANTYRYYKLLQDQAKDTGTLADTPPAPIKGNVTNINNTSELVLGYFYASSVSEKRIMLDRRNTKRAIYNGLFRFLYNREPTSDDRAKAPDAICKPSRTRTNTFPIGWK